MRGKARKLYLAMGLALVAMFVAAGAVFAAVTFDPATGTGFVGKGDVQQQFGWNNQALNANASGVTFAYVTSTERTRVCQTPGRPDLRLTEVVTRSQEVTSEVTYETRNNKKGAITGFTLTGLGAETSTSVVTDDEGNPITVGPNGCPDGYNPQGPPVESSSAELRAIHNGISKVIWTPPAPEPEPTV